MTAPLNAPLDPPSHLSLTPCGPVADAKAAARAIATLREAAEREGWSDRLQRAEPALEPVFAASSYLESLARKKPERLWRTLDRAPHSRLTEILAQAREAGADPNTAGVRLRRLKADAHLLIALCDLGGVWGLDEVTDALSRFADASLASALEAAARLEVERGRLTRLGEAEAGPAPGFFFVAMGKHGASELNYSSDIDVSAFFDPEVLPLAPGVEPQAFAVRLTQAVSALMQERTAEGYVFRVDLRLRPDPAATPIAVPVGAALDYYESVGQNWERAAFIKARPAAGDIPAGEDFLHLLQPFVWRRHLDFAAISDIHSIKRQIHAFKTDERLTAKGADLKLGRGGIREIEFYVQTQQLILGGRSPGLRARRTVEALGQLQAAGHVSPEAASELAEAYRTLRGLEHRVQMLNDEQTHRLPENDAERRKVAALAGYDRLPPFDAAVTKLLKRVNRRYGELFAEEEDLSSRFGSLVFTGVEDDPETLRTLGRMGFQNPSRVSATIRGWHHGRIPATRTERGRELFTRLAPRLLEAAQATAAPEAAFTRFAEFFERLPSGVQVQSLFLAHPEMFRLVIEVLAFAPDLAATLARRPAALDALFDPAFFRPIREHSGVTDALVEAALGASTFEAAMDAVRRYWREQSFRVGVQILSGTATAEEAGEAFADLADACVRALAPPALREVERLAGRFPGRVAVVGLGKLGSREMTARSDLDLMTVYESVDSTAMSDAKGWGAETFYGRFTQRLVAALSAPTAEGRLFEVDLQLRPSGTAGPIAVSVPALERYYAEEAETWEVLALTRARVVWASDDAFAYEVARCLEATLRRPRRPPAAAGDVRAMRELMERERPPQGFWDMKLSRGGLVDVEFAAQLLQIVSASRGGPLVQSTAAALEALKAFGLATAREADCLVGAWRLQQNLSQTLKIALAEGADPDAEPAGLGRLLARAGGARDWPALKKKLQKIRRQARAAYEAVLSATEAGGSAV